MYGISVKSRLYDIIIRTYLTISIYFFSLGGEGGVKYIVGQTRSKDNHGTGAVLHKTDGIH